MSNEIERRKHRGEVENTWAGIENLFRPLVQDDVFAQEVASAFYNVAWVPLESPFQSYSDAFGQPQTFTMTWRNAGGFVADLRGKGENYLDWCFDANSEEISPRVLELMTSLGLRPVT